MTDQTVDKAKAIEDVDMVPHRSLWGDVWRQFRQHKGGMAAAIIFILIIIAVLIGPWLYGIDPETPNYRSRQAPPSWDHWLGTDRIGRDGMAWLLAGGQISMAVGIVGMLVSLVVGTIIGILAGYFKWLDGLLMRTTDLFLCLPLLPLLLILTTFFREPLRAAFGPELGVFLLIVFAIGITSWMQTARVVRGEVLGVKAREFVLAAQSIGTREGRIVTRHIFPNVLSPIMVSATLGIAAAIITESALSFLGLGFPSDFPTWGRLLYDNKDYLERQPLLAMAPGIAISVTVLCVNFIGDALRDALDPRIRGR